MDIEAILQGDDEEALKELKLFLFKENVRLQNEKRELQEATDKLIKERAQFRTEMDLLNHKMVQEHKRLKDENMFFEKKMEILRAGYREIEEQKDKLEKDRFRFKMEQDLWKNQSMSLGRGDELAQVLFRGANNPISLRKRYRDLLKIFHPDNLAGDDEIVQIINREYDRRKRAEQKPV